jgi:hypothetical protein
MTDMPDRREPRFVYLSDAVPRPAGGVSARTRQPAPSRFGWRLDAANHRPMARAGSVSASLADCVSAAALVRARIDEASVLVSAGGDRGLWAWRIEDEGVVVAVSPHAFPRRVECTRAYAQFRVALDQADPDRGVLRNFGPRALRGFDVDGFDMAAVVGS